MNIFKGATIGLTGGNKSRAPIIGDKVQIGINSSTIGNPCRIIHRQYATNDFVYFLV